MQYEAETEKAAMMAGGYASVVRPMSLAEEPQIKRTRKVLLVIFGICLALCAVAFIIGIVGLMDQSNSQATQKGYAQLGLSLISIFIYSFGVFVTYKYYQTGLRVFAWLGVIGLIPMGFYIAVLLFGIFMALASIAIVEDPEVKNTLIMALVFLIIATVIYIAAFALTIIVIKLIFKLARLIDANEHLTIQQV